MKCSERSIGLLGILLAVVIAGCGEDPASSATALDGDGGVDRSAEGTDRSQSHCDCAPGTWDHDRRPWTACVPWRTCAPGTSVKRQGTSQSDRECRACGQGTYSDTANAPRCMPHTACEAGTYVELPGTPRSNRMCVECASGTYSTRRNVRACTEWTHCAPGLYVGTPGTTTSNNVCASCASGTFSSVVDAMSCSPFTDCVPGQYIVAAGAPTADRICDACASGFYSSQVNSSACMPVGTCAPGTVQTVPTSSTAPVSCAMCEVGTYCAGGTAAAVPCAPGTWDDDASAASQCLAWSECASGFYVAEPGSAIDDRACEPCADGFYSDTANAGACMPVGECAAGFRQTAAGTSTSPVRCEACEVGMYCAGGGAAPVMCADGTWDRDANPATLCAAWTDCRAGQYVSTGGTNVSDRVCMDCVNGDTSSSANAVSCSPGAWILSYFGPNQDVPNDSLHLAYSMDGLKWSTLAGGQPVYQVSGIGTNHIRDPFIFRKNDGTFVYMATDWTRASNELGYWSNPSPAIFIADSVDLVTFTNPRLVKLTDLPGPNGMPMHAWAPEAYFDADRNAYAIVWSGGDTTWRNRIYVSYTNDFTTILNETPDVLFDPGYDVIDATIERSNGRNYLFFKDETDNSGSSITGTGKDIQIARSDSYALTPGSFTRWDPRYITRGTSQGTRQGTEGPLAVFSPQRNQWLMYADFYGNGGVFGGWSTPSLDADPSTWTRLSSSEFSFPSGVRHAHAVRVTQAELESLIARYGVAHRIRTTYSEGGVPFYVAHSWFHGIISPEADRANGLLASDFVWKAVPGLADPNDPNLVSFEAVGWPGRYLRIDSVNPNRYPSCGEPSNRGWALCWIGGGDRHHLMWLDAYENTTTFRNDVTFRRVPALNGNSAMVSLQWYSDPSRYLRHIAYQMFATPISGSVQMNDASFIIERE